MEVAHLYGNILVCPWRNWGKIRKEFCQDIRPPGRDSNRRPSGSETGVNFLVGKTEHYCCWWDAITQGLSLLTEPSTVWASPWTELVASYPRSPSSDLGCRIIYSLCCLSCCFSVPRFECRYSAFQVGHGNSILFQLHHPQFSCHSMLCN
jgi:hypothetical protein